MWQNSNHNGTKLKNSKCDKTQKLIMCQISKTQNGTKLKSQNVTKLKNSKCNKTQKLKIGQNSKTQNVTKLKK